MNKRETRQIRQLMLMKKKILPEISWDDSDKHFLSGKRESDSLAISRTYPCREQRSDCQMGGELRGPIKKMKMKTSLGSLR